MKVSLLSVVAFFWSVSSVFSQSDWENKDDAAILHRAEKALTDVIIHDIFSPPVASRIYVYANIAAYEVLVKANDSCRSLHGRIHAIPEIALPEKKISFPLAAVYSFLLTGKKLVFSEPVLEDSINNILKMYKSRRLPAAVYIASLEYGKKVSDAIITWASKDQYNETRKLRRYQFAKQEGKWIPTPPGYMAAIEPYWNRIRTLALDSACQFKPHIAEIFSKEKNSLFYKQAYEVYETGTGLSKEQKDIANFWDCNPFFLNTEGHLNFATKKISPGGHWIAIAGILSTQQNAGMMKASAVYTCLSIALFDAFICCWDEKYGSNVIRPETYINSYIDESWRPILQTPPFPEYPSGHSVVSTAAAIVLTRLFGENFSFTDNTEIEFGLPERKFSSIIEAAKEAAISRLYGGIHYRAAIENGREQGENIGKYIVAKIVDDTFLYRKL
jgi:hypothetical protein